MSWLCSTTGLSECFNLAGCWRLLEMRSSLLFSFQSRWHPLRSLLFSVFCLSLRPLRALPAALAEPNFAFVSASNVFRSPYSRSTQPAIQGRPARTECGRPRLRDRPQIVAVTSTGVSGPEGVTGAHDGFDYVARRRELSDSTVSHFEFVAECDLPTERLAIVQSLSFGIPS